MRIEVYNKLITRRYIDQDYANDIAALAPWASCIQPTWACEPAMSGASLGQVSAHCCAACLHAHVQAVPAWSLTWSADDKIANSILLPCKAAGVSELLQIG